MSRAAFRPREAVHRLGELLEQLLGSVADTLEAAGSSGELLSSDRLQGLAEILQNADDTGASEVRLLLRDDDLLMNHNGEEVRLRHLLGVAMPWFSKTHRIGKSWSLRDRSFGTAFYFQHDRSALQPVPCPVGTADSVIDRAGTTSDRIRRRRMDRLPRFVNRGRS